MIPSRTARDGETVTDRGEPANPPARKVVLDGPRVVH